MNFFPHQEGHPLPDPDESFLVVEERSSFGSERILFLDQEIFFFIPENQANYDCDGQDEHPVLDQEKEKINSTALRGGWGA